MDAIGTSPYMIWLTSINILAAAVHQSRTAQITELQREQRTADALDRALDAPGAGGAPIQIRLRFGAHGRELWAAKHGANPSRIFGVPAFAAIEGTLLLFERRDPPMGCGFTVRDDRYEYFVPQPSAVVVAIKSGALVQYAEGETDFGEECDRRFLDEWFDT